MTTGLFFIYMVIQKLDSIHELLKTMNTGIPLHFTQTQGFTRFFRFDQ